jgi:hypothetical protein
MAFASGAKFFGSLWPYDPKRQRIGEDRRSIDELMRGPVKGGAVGGKAGPASFHMM